MAGKYDGMMKNRKLPAGTGQEIDETMPAKGAGRPKKSKTGNPDYRVTTLRAHIDTFADAEANVRKLRIDMDMSDLINKLLREWNLNPKP